MKAVQVNIRLDESVYEELRKLAEEDGTNVTQIVKTAIYRSYPSVRSSI